MTRARGAAALALASGLVLHLSAAVAPASEGSAGVVQKFLSSQAGTHSYRATRRLEAAGSGLRAWMEAETEFAPGDGFRYEVTAEGGSRIIRSRVLRSLLEEERQLIARGGSGEVALSPANYHFMLEGVDEDGLARVGLQPLRKERALIAGEMLVQPDDGALVRLEGQLAKNPSFWTKRVDVVRSYERINDVVMPVTLESKAQLRLFGGSTLRMTYRYSEIDGRPVADPR